MSNSELYHTRFYSSHSLIDVIINNFIEECHFLGSFKWEKFGSGTILLTNKSTLKPEAELGERTEH